MLEEDDPVNLSRRDLVRGLGSLVAAPYWMRIAPSVYNDMRDVERLLEALS